jgi:hypothetical protein
MSLENLILFALVIVIVFASINIANDYLCVEKMSTNNAKYRVVFMSNWGKDPHISHPSNPHTGNMFLVTHNDKLFKVGQLASKGVSQTSMYGTLNDLFSITNKNKHIGNIVTSGALETPGSVDLMIDVSPNMSNLSFVTMVAPSSDWFTGFSIDLMRDGNWLKKKTIPLFVYIAGTDSNQGFVTEHIPRTTPEPIKIKRDKFLYPDGKIVPIAYVGVYKVN